MGGGGKNKAPAIQDPAREYVDPVDGTTYESPEDLNAHIAQRQANDKTTSDAATQAAADKATADEATFTGRRDTAYNDALQAITRSFQLQGADPNAYMNSDILPALNRQRNSIQDLDPNPSGAFPVTMGDTLISDIISGKRTGATSAVNKAFAPDYSTSLIPDTADDPYISQIVNEQFDPLSAQLTNARKRNTLTDVGYGAANDALNQKRSAALSSVGNLGSGILASDRSGIDDIVSGARTAASGVGINDTFDPSTYASRASGAATQDLTDLPGALRNAVGGTKFADLTELINAGGAVQGANNPTAANPLGGGAALPVVSDDEKKRGLGSVGAF